VNKTVSLKIVKGSKITSTTSKTATSTFYDSFWMEKQEHGFGSWLNFILNPSSESELEGDGLCADGKAKNKKSISSSGHHAHAILARKQQYAALQRHAFSIYHRYIPLSMLLMFTS